MKNAKNAQKTPSNEPQNANDAFNDSRKHNAHLYPVSRAFQDFWEEITDQPFHASNDKILAWKGWVASAKALGTIIPEGEWLNK